jgi:hypothetical protein
MAQQQQQQQQQVVPPLWKLEWGSERVGDNVHGGGDNLYAAEEL